MVYPIRCYTLRRENLKSVVERLCLETVFMVMVALEQTVTVRKSSGTARTGFSVKPIAEQRCRRSVLNGWDVVNATDDLRQCCHLQDLFKTQHIVQ